MLYCNVAHHMVVWSATKWILTDLSGLQRQEYMVLEF